MVGSVKYNGRVPAQILHILLIVVLLMGCARLPIQDNRQALRLSTTPDSLTDDLPLTSFINGVDQQINFLQQSKDAMLFGEISISPQSYRNALIALKQFAQGHADGREILDYILKNFDFYEVYGQKRWGEIQLTSYFEPVILGSPTPTPIFSEALYKQPEELVEVLGSQFDSRFAGRSLRGRILKERSKSGLQQIAPFFSRKEIQKGALAKRKLEWCWVDPIDAFILHTQGSGTVLLPDRPPLRLGFAEQNGHPYRALGSYLLDKIPLEEMTLQKIEGHLHKLTEQEAINFLEKNPSFIFFRKLDSAPLTSNGTQVIEGRTLAADSQYFPKGALAYLEFSKPQFEEGRVDKIQWIPTQRLVFDQDSGGAIRGPGRADLFAGKGEQSKHFAGNINQMAKLFYLAPKSPAHP